MHLQEACEELMSEPPWRSTAALRSTGWCHSLNRYEALPQGDTRIHRQGCPRSRVSPPSWRAAGRQHGSMSSAAGKSRPRHKAPGCCTRYALQPSAPQEIAQNVIPLRDTDLHTLHDCCAGCCTAPMQSLISQLPLSIS